LLQEHPEFSEGWLLLGRWYLLQNQLPQAEQAIQHHLLLEPRSVHGLFQLGLAQMQQQLFAAAWTNFAQAT
jgi:cytochrome c-type biogenesis protein CcmH/NrfG